MSIYLVGTERYTVIGTIEGGAVYCLRPYYDGHQNWMVNCARVDHLGGVEIAINTDAEDIEMPTSAWSWVSCFSKDEEEMILSAIREYECEASA